MRDHVTPASLSVFLLSIGGILLDIGVTDSQNGETTISLLSGAAILSLGLYALAIGLRNWWYWKKFQRKNGGS